MTSENAANQTKVNDDSKPSYIRDGQIKGMDEREIKLALMEAARQNMLEILEEEMRLENVLSDLPETTMVISIIKKQLGLDKESELPGDLDKEQIIKVSETIKNSLGAAVSDAFKDVIKQPKLLKALQKLYSTHSDDFSSLDSLLSTRYADVLLDFAERYMETPNWKKTEALLITAESLVKNITGAAKPRLYARMDVDWGIYLWKCGDYSEAEKKFEKANAGISVLLNKHGKEITDPAEITKNIELRARVLHGFGVLYEDFLEDKRKAIEYFKDCLSALSKLEETYKNKKMKTSLLNNLGVAYHKMSELHPDERVGHLNESITHYEAALATARSIRYTKMVGWLLFNAGEIYALLGQLEKAQNYSRESRKIFSEEVVSDRGMSGVEMLDAVINMQKKDYSEAMECINNSIELREKIGEPRRIADAVDYRGNIYLASGEKGKAAEDHQRANAIYKSIGSQAGIKKTEEKIKSAA
jgi:tetratricopeptide (TPR) repeat protein